MLHLASCPVGHLRANRPETFQDTSVLFKNPHRFTLRFVRKDGVRVSFDTLAPALMTHLGDDDRLPVLVWLARSDLPQMVLPVLTNQDKRAKQDAVTPFWLNLCRSTRP